MKDPFEFVGKYLLVMMVDEAFYRTFMFGQPVPGQEGIWIVAGRVVGEIPGGFWLEALTITSPSSETAAVAESGQEGVTYLVRWHDVYSARLSPVAFKSIGEIGFRPQLP